jgi:hypothetical protein
MTVNQQLRDAQAVVEGLRAQNTILQNRVHDLERACDRAELKLEMVRMTQGRGGTRERRRARSPKREPVRCERLYPDGGRMTYWVSAQSTDDDGDDENINPWDTFNDEHSHVVSHRQTPTPGPSRLPASPPPTSSGVRSAFTSNTYEPPSMVSGNAVELVMTPHRGPAVAVVISPAAQKHPN